MAREAGIRQFQVLSGRHRNREKSMKILVAGGAGYIGSALIPRLIDRGYEIGVVDLLWFGNHLPPEVKVTRKNIYDLKEDEVRGYDQVIFLGGLSNDPMAEFSPSMNFVYNAAAPAYLAYISKKVNVRRFIYAGSCSVYGYTVNQLYDETAPAISKHPYGISKLQGEQAAIQMSEKSFSVICFRQGTISGYSPRMRLDLIVNTMFKTALEKREIVINNPSIWRPVLSMEDACNAYIRAIEASDEISGIFNIASGNYTVGESGDLVRSALERKLSLNIKLTIKHIQDYRNYKVSTEKAMNVLSFKPKHDVDSITDDLIKNMDRFKDYSNPNYYNIQVFQNIKNHSV
jgi:nucleoside-diphosphate-sugar epimerase